MFLIIAICSKEIFAIDTWGDVICSLGQAHAYDPSNYMGLGFLFLDHDI